MMGLRSFSFDDPHEALSSPIVVQVDSQESKLQEREVLKWIRPIVMTEVGVSMLE